MAEARQPGGFPRPSRRPPLQRWLRLPGFDLWDVDPEGLGWIRRQAVAVLRVAHLVWRGYRDDACQLHASALTYYTLMSIVPLLALGLALARVFGGDAIARERIRGEIARFGGQLATHAQGAPGSEAGMVADFVAQLTRYADRIFDQIAQIGFGTLGGIGLIVLLWMAVSMLSQVEHSFNQVWSAPGRSLWRKCSDYLTLVIIVPFLALAATTLPVASVVSRHLGGLVGSAWLSGEGGFVLRQGATLLLTVVLFVVVLMFVPNTRVRFRPALAGGLVTAVCFLAWLWLCTRLQVGVIKFSKLYGGFAVVPILLAWVYTSWQIVLLGAELAFACQHATTYGREQGARHAGLRARGQLALAVAAEMARVMQTGEGPFAANRFAQRYTLSVRLLNDVIDDLLQAGLIAETADRPGHYVLLRDPSRLTAAVVVRAVLDRGHPPEALGLDHLDPRIRDYARQAEQTWADALEMPVARLVGPPAGQDGVRAT
ncbi:MAG: YihY family inner membrane protein [Lentisphaerae bacterium]|nr:YihY family inner membrane protein [Lentisphaerota bacterium]